MIYYLSDMSEIDQKVVDLMKQHFDENIKWGSIYREYRNLSISKIHPFVRMLSDTDTNKPKDVLPAVAVALLEDNGVNAVLDRGEETIEITTAILQELEDQKYNLNRENIFDNLYKLIGGGSKIFAQKVNRRFNQNLVIEIWTDNDIIKDVLYEGIKDFFDFYLGTMFDLGMENVSLNGRKDGDYNFDFGTVLYGASITVSFNIANMVFIVDTAMEEIAEIVHHEGDITGTTLNSQ